MMGTIDKKIMAFGEDCQTDLRKLLDNLAEMIACYQNMLTETAREAFLVPLCVEVSVVTLKLKALHRRWQQYLPFQEAIDVDFCEEAKTVTSWLSVLGVETDDTECEYDRFVPDKGFLLDLMDLDIEPVKLDMDGDELKTVAENYFNNVDKYLKKKRLGDWETKTIERLSQDLKNLIAQKDSECAAREVCVQAVACLADELNSIGEFFTSDLVERQFRTLAIRLIHRDCSEAVKEAHDKVRKEHNAWPKRSEKDRALAMKEEVKLTLLCDARGEGLKEYIDLDYPALLEDACFGQFLFKMRHKLTVGEVQLMVKYCTMIQDLNQLIDPASAGKKRKEIMVGRKLDAEDEALMKQLEKLAEKGEWCNGATSDSIVLGLRQMLGVGFQLDGKMQTLSDELWKLLKSRRGCDAEKSLMVTWLNIVGYCVKVGLLSGTSPRLCSHFFSKRNPDDYKAIDKGKSNPPDAFKKIEPLLDKFLK